MGRKRAVEPEVEEVVEEVEELVEETVNDKNEDNSHWTREILVPVPLSSSNQHIKIISWNVNGLKALVTTKKQILTTLVERHQPDILCFQETKIQDTTIGDYDNLLDGYDAFWNCSTVKKGYSGTAVLMKRSTISIPAGLVRSGSAGGDTTQAPKKQAKLSSFFKKNVSEPIVAPADVPAASAGTSVKCTNPLASVLKVSYDFEDEKRGHHGEGRTITVEFDSFVLVACYVPNSGEGLRRLDYRIDEWEPHMRAYLKTLSARKPVVYTGDLNVGHLDLDIHNPHAKHIVKQSGLTPVERAAFQQMLDECGYKDAFRHLYPDAKGQFTYWSQRLFHRGPNKGIRLDYFICSNDMFPAADGSAEVGEAKAGKRAVQVHDSYILHADTVGSSFAHTFDDCSQHIFKCSKRKDLSVTMDEETKFMVKFGCGSTVGGRPYQEDRLVATRLNGSADQTFFAVFDGHGGDRCSEFLSKSFYKALLVHPKFSSLPIVALQETWAGFDEKCLAQLKQLESNDPQRILPGDGSTATACVIVSNDIYLTNCGDSAAYAIHQDGRTELLTEDHGTNNAEEVARCMKAGGELKPQFYTQPYPFPLCFLHRSKPAKPRMLPGGLLVTRSFGDFNSKLEYLGGKKGVVVSSHGRISYINAAKSPPKYLILASDGVWDVLSIEDVSSMIDQFFLKRTIESRPSASSNPDNVVSDPSSRAAKASPAMTPRKNSPHKVFPETATGSVTDLVEPACTASLVESELINARYTDLDADLNELSTMIVHAAANSPKWKTLGCSADNTSMIIISFCPKKISEPETE